MKSDSHLLRNILKCCDDIQYYLDYFGPNEETFFEEKMFQQGCAFIILQIGEAVNALSDEVKKNNEYVDWKGIIGLRNIIVHVYSSIDIESLWEVIIHDIPQLKSDCEKILETIERK